jgi:hypothetical protein|tara:strand:+ start:256 stop:501 length:246 start_codon:yes stop_codon:yes gene_type:complete
LGCYFFIYGVGCGAQSDCSNKERREYECSVKKKKAPKPKEFGAFLDSSKKKQWYLSRPLLFERVQKILLLFAKIISKVKRL